MSILRYRHDSRYWDIEYLWKISFDHYYRLSPEIAATIKPEKIKGCMKGLIDLVNGDYSPICDKTIMAECPFSIPLEGKEFLLPTGEQLKITGRIDRVDQLDHETLEIIDWKSGVRSNFISSKGGKTDASTLIDDIQPRLYHLAATKLWPHIKNFLITFYYLSDGGPVTVILTERDIPKTLDMLKRKFDAIRVNVDPERDYGTWKCKYICGFYKNGICDTVWQEKKDWGIEFVKNKYTVLNHK